MRSLVLGSQKHKVFPTRYEPLAITVPSDENDTEWTLSECPRRDATHSPVLTFHSPTVLSSLAVASN